MSQYVLAVLLLKQRDFEGACAWCEKAAAQGHERAVEYLQYMKLRARLAAATDFLDATMSS